MDRQRVENGFEPFGEAFEKIVADGTPAALQVRQEGVVVVDLAAGTTTDGRPMRTDVPVFLYSAIKPVAALAVLLAVTDGYVGLTTPVSRFWRAFGAHGKDRVTVRDLLAHGAAVPGWRDPLTLDAYADTAAAAERLAASPPWWEPGEPGEHALSYGHLLDGVLRHGTGRDIVSWWPEVVAATGVPIDLTAGTGARLPAPLDDPGGAWLASWQGTDGIMGELLNNPAELLDVGTINSVGRRLVAPAVTGYASAADLAALWAWWVGGGATRRLGRELQATSVEPVLSGHDHVLDAEVSWGLGPQVDAGAAGMGGVGGCVGWVEFERRLSIGFVTPRVGPTGRADALDDAVAALG